MSARYGRSVTSHRGSLRDSGGRILSPHLFGGRGFFTAPRLKFDPALVFNHTMVVNHPNGHFKIRIHTVGVGNHLGKLSKTARHCKAGLDMRTLGTAALYWISIMPSELTLEASVNPASASEVFRAIAPHLNAMEEAEIRKGMTGHILVAFALESTNKAYYAAFRPYPVELRAPDWSQGQAGANFVQVVVSEEDSDVLSSQPLLLWVESWETSFLANTGEPRKLSKKETTAILSQIGSKDKPSS